MEETSQKQIEANRQNAKLGGVKTEEGKAVSRYNAIKHGILTTALALENENETELEELGKAIRSELKPANEVEMLLAERIISNTWRLKRAIIAEREMIEHDTENEKNFGTALSYDFANYDSYGKFTRYETCLERGIYKALHELQRLQAIRNGQKVALPAAIDIDVNQQE
ncbi:MAG TPA: hypothetical protein P5080_05075 [Candidatus Paceibacterota bacterium]|nr:hypothetical protein [Candidatus Pacearchaeota archaeon]HRZ51319.1 hypothetical protein [Candidatus Paceibacterota bacterium]HSA37041.1 hypothetical protein [Candidatus Paceibacterota bacterium]